MAVVTKACWSIPFVFSTKLILSVGNRHPTNLARWFSSPFQRSHEPGEPWTLQKMNRIVEKKLWENATELGFSSEYIWFRILDGRANGRVMTSEVDRRRWAGYEGPDRTGSHGKTPRISPTCKSNNLINKNQINRSFQVHSNFKSNIIYNWVPHYSTSSSTELRGGYNFEFAFLSLFELSFQDHRREIFCEDELFRFRTRKGILSNSRNYWVVNISRRGCGTFSIG